MDDVTGGDEAAVVAWLDGGGHVDALWDAQASSLRSLTMLMFASAGGHAEIVDLLLERKASVDLQDSDGRTALMNAARFGHTAIVQRLLKAGAHIALRNREGKTAVRMAKEQGHTACSEAFREHVQAAAQRTTVGDAEGTAQAQDPTKLPQRVMEAVVHGNKAAELDRWE